jgi:hypothetical protein
MPTWPEPTANTVTTSPVLQFAEPSTNDAGATVTTLESVDNVTLTSTGGACVKAIVTGALESCASRSAHGDALICSD